MALPMAFKILYYLNFAVVAVIGLIYSHQAVYMIIGGFIKRKHPDAKMNHKYAILISARNEELVIGKLIKSLENQNYPKSMYDIFVIADNCTDQTAEVARNCGVVVYERQNKELVGKGYALDHLINKIFKEHDDKGYEAFIFFDADNVAGYEFIKEINKLYDEGFPIGMGYRNSKNFSDNWISMGHCLSFMKEARFAHGVRDQFNMDTYINGTGFFADIEILRKEGGWKYFMMTEDLEFGFEQCLKGNRIGFNRDAVFYDEQPITLKDSFNQRTRWIKGQMQCLKQYAGKLFKRFIKKGEFTGFDLMMHIFPGHLVFVSWTVIYSLLMIILGGIYFVISPVYLYIALISFALSVLTVFISTFAMALLIVIVENKRIMGTTAQKFKAIFFFPIFILTFVPISYKALFTKVEWVHIPHTRNVDEKVLIENEKTNKFK